MSTTSRELVEATLRRVLELTPSRRVDPEETFDHYGLDSISGFRLARLLSAALEIDVEPRSIAEHPTIAALAAFLATRPRAGVPSVTGPRPESVCASPSTPVADRAPARGVMVEQLLAVLERSPQLVEALRGLHAKPSAPPPERSVAPVGQAHVDFGFIFFSSNAQEDGANPYAYVSHIAQYADTHGFSAIWVPERHFSPFGGRFPDPGLLLAYLAAQTQHLRLRSGSVVLPLHHPARIAESWSMLDQLSGGRVDMACASGWSVNDFVLSPDTYASLRDTWIQRMALVKRLWRGESVPFPNGQGTPTPVAIYPRPIQPELNLWMTVTGEERSFIDAGRHGYNVLTMLQSRSIEQLGENIAKYREARRAAGFDPDAGRVTLMLHTYVHPDEATVARTVETHFRAYILSALRGHVQRMAQQPTEAEIAGIVEHSYAHQYRHSALFGDVDHCAQVVRRMCGHGVNEIACLVDFGPREPEMYATLPFIRELMLRVNETAAPPAPPLPSVRVAAPDAPPATTRAVQDEYAIVGLSGRYPDAADLEQFWQNLLANRNCLREIDQLRREDLAGAAPDDDPLGDIKHFGLLDNIYRFDASFFGLSPREAEILDPHMRVLLEQVWQCIENAGYAPGSLTGSRTGVFASFYNYEYGTLLEEREVDRRSEPYLATATAGAIVANRISYIFGWRGPSEVYNTACSSALVALHRAVQAMACGDCDRAVVAGVNLLLTGARVRALSRLGILSERGVCNPFSYPANGEVLGEGAGAILLRPLQRALADGDYIYAIVSGTDVGHPGSQSGSLTMPSASMLTELMARTYDRLGIDRTRIRYIEGHGAGSAVDVVELAAYQALLADGRERREPVPVGSVKSNIGFGEGSGGIAQLTKCALALNHGIVPATLHFSEADPSFDLKQAAVTIQTANAVLDESSAPPFVSVVAYGLGGSAAHVAMRQHRLERPVAAEPEVDWRHPMAFSAASPEQLAQLVERVAAHLGTAETRHAYARLCGGERGVLESIALTLVARDRGQAHRVVILADSLAELLEACRDFASGTPRDHVITSSHQPLFPQPEQIIDACLEKKLTRELAVFWASGFQVAWARLYDTPAFQRLPLPGVPFTGDWLRLPRKPSAGRVSSIGDRLRVSRTEGGHVIELAVRSDDYFISQHVVDGTPIMPATGYLGLLSAISREVFGRPCCLLRGVTWVSPFEVSDDSVLLRIECDSRGRFQAYRIVGDGKSLCCSGRLELTGEASLAPRLDPAAIAGAEVILDGAAYWDVADSDVSKQKHGPILRRLDRILRVGDQLIAVLKPPATRVSLPEIAWLDAALGVTLGFPVVEGLVPSAALAFSLEAFASVRPFPVDTPLYAVATRRAENGSPFDISVEDASGVYAALTGFAVRGFDRLRPAARIRPVHDTARAGLRVSTARPDTALHDTVTLILGDLLRVSANAMLEHEDLRSLGLDSIGAHELALQLGVTFDIDISPTMLLEQRTVRDLCRCVTEVYGDRVTAAP